MYAASALAANTITRSALAAAFPLFTVQMFEGVRRARLQPAPASTDALAAQLGTQWACTLLGCIGLVLLPSPFLFYKFGPRLRQRSQYAPCPDLKVKQEIEDEEKRAAEGSSGQA
jgi:DHA1 family multidrug resistance protein-like MFS transporter